MKCVRFRTSFPIVLITAGRASVTQIPVHILPARLDIFVQMFKLAIH